MEVRMWVRKQALGERGRYWVSEADVNEGNKIVGEEIRLWARK
jgi:hypothetical protein